LLDNGFVECDKEEVDSYIMFYIGTPLDTRMFNNDIIYILISESTKDIYNSVKESDWSNAGLAALTLLPFVPSGIRNIKAATRYVPSVNKGLDQRMLDNAFNSIKEKREYLSDVANERNRVLESVNGYAHRVRAQKADQMFGTNYNETYDLLSDLYEHHFFDLPEV